MDTNPLPPSTRIISPADAAGYGSGRPTYKPRPVLSVMTGAETDVRSKPGTAGAGAGVGSAPPPAPPKEPPSAPARRYVVPPPTDERTKAPLSPPVASSLPSHVWPASHTSSPKLKSPAPLGTVNPDRAEYVDGAQSQRLPTDAMSPGHKFGYWSQKEYLITNLGDVKDFRSARHMVLEAETAMTKTMMLERTKCKRQVGEALRVQNLLQEKLDEERMWREAILQEKEMAFEAMERGLMQSEDMRHRLITNQRYQVKAEQLVAEADRRSEEARLIMADHERQLEEQQRAHQAARDAEESARQAMETMGQEVAQMRQHTEETLAEYEEELTKCKKQFSDAHEEAEHLRNMHDGAVAENASLKHRVGELEAALEEALAEQARVQARLDQYVQDEAQMHNQLERMQLEVEARMEAASRGVQSDLSTTRSRLEEKEGETRVLQQGMLELSSNLSAQTEAYRQLRADHRTQTRELKDAQREAKALQKELDASRLECDAMRDHLGLSKAEEGKLRAEAEELRLQAQRLRQSAGQSTVTSTTDDNVALRVGETKAVEEDSKDAGSGDDSSKPAWEQYLLDAKRKQEAEAAATASAMAAAAVPMAASAGPSSDEDVNPTGAGVDEAIRAVLSTGDRTAEKASVDTGRSTTRGRRRMVVTYDAFTGRPLSTTTTRRRGSSTTRKRSVSPAPSKVSLAGTGTGGPARVLPRMPQRETTAKMSSHMPMAVMPGDQVFKVNEEKTYLANGLKVLTAAGWKRPNELVEDDLLFRANGTGYDQIPITRVYSVVAEPYMMKPGFLDTPFVVAKVDSSVSAAAPLHAAPAGQASTPGSRRARSRPKARPAGASGAPSSAASVASSHGAVSTPRRRPARRSASAGRGRRRSSLTPGLTTPLQAGVPKSGKAYLIRPPEGMCGHGNSATPSWPAKVFGDGAGGFGVVWECCAAKGLASSQMVPSHHSNKTVLAVDCPILAEVNLE